MVGGVLAGIVSGVLPVGVGDPLPVQLSSVGRWRCLGVGGPWWWSVRCPAWAG